MVVGILGCGWYGIALAKRLIDQGIVVKGSTTSSGKLDILRAAGILPFLIRIDGTEADKTEPEFFNCDQLIVANNVKMDHLDNYLSKVRKTIRLIQNGSVDRVIFISSISVYGDHNQEVDENTLPKPGKGSGISLLEGEKLLLAQENLNCTILRFAGLVGPGRDPARFFAGKTGIPNGAAPVNLIHLEDCVGMTEKLLQNPQLKGIFNGVSPHHPSKMDFYTHAAKRKSLALPVFKAEKLEWKIVNSLYVKQQLDYDFKVQNWFDDKIAY